MVVGPSGPHGDLAALHAEVGRGNGHERARTRNLRTVERTALGNHKIVKNATAKNAVNMFVTYAFSTVAQYSRLKAIRKELALSHFVSSWRLSR